MSKKVITEQTKNGQEYEVPVREKIVRDKDRHESGTGRRDKIKRQGKGKGNVGNYQDDMKYMDYDNDDSDYSGEYPEEETKGEKN